MNPRKGITDTADANSTQNTEQRSDRQHTGLRTLDEHFSADQVFRACHAPYPGTEVLDHKHAQQARASGARVRKNSEGVTAGFTATAAKDRRGESGVGL